VARDDGDWTTAERAPDAIRNGLGLLASSPFSCRKAAPDNTFLREWIIAFGASDYVALFEIDDAKRSAARARKRIDPHAGTRCSATRPLAQLVQAHLAR
jgi:hypothetical protein